MTEHPPPADRCADSPAALVAIARAAHLARDRELVRAAVRELRERYGMTLTFARRPRHGEGVRRGQ